MTTPLTNEEEQEYTRVIDAILFAADLETVSRRKVRKGLEKALGGKDLSDQKSAIKALIESRFDAINSQSQSPGANAAASNPDDGHPNNAHNHHTHSPPKREYSTLSGDGDGDGSVNGGANGYSGSYGRDGAIESIEDGYVKPTKKVKRSSSSVEDADALLAAKLQAQENSLARVRSTRGGGSAKVVKPRKKAAKKKSSLKVGEGDDSAVESDVSGSAAKEKRKAGGGFQKPFLLSYQLGELVGETQLSRPQVVKKLWEHIKSNELQDPTDKRVILCDEKMQAVFKQHKVDMFQMNKLLGNHLYPVEEE